MSDLERFLKDEIKDELCREEWWQYSPEDVRNSIVEMHIEKIAKMLITKSYKIRH